MLTTVVCVVTVRSEDVVGRDILLGGERLSMTSALARKHNL